MGEKLILFYITLLRKLHLKMLASDLVKNLGRILDQKARREKELLASQKLPNQKAGPLKVSLNSK